jgi:hypothetical protein
VAKVEGYQERLHWSLYDSIFIPDPAGGAAPTPGTFESAMTDPRVIRFFADMQNKTKLETNMQAAGVLPSQNTFEARALRVVMSSVLFKRGDTPQEKAKQVIEEPEVLAALIYNTTTTLFVGEKVMFEGPTFLFPSGAGVQSGFPTVVNHGHADPAATFRFAEPVVIEKQQNFRVELAFPRGVPPRLARATGPLHVWVVLDGYLMRDVQ